MAAKGTRTKEQREYHRQVIAEKYLQQYRQSEIAELLGIDQSTVSRDLQAVQKQWRESALINMDEAKQRELERIDVLEREYWQAWHDSKGQRTVETSKKAARGANNDSAVKITEQSTRTEDLLGDPRFLSGIQWCIQMRAKILGIEAATTVNVNIENQWLKAIANGDIDYAVAVDELGQSRADHLFRQANVPIAANSDSEN